jgi:hypothetical protein
MLENAVLACPSTQWHGYLWSDHSEHPLPPEFAAFWYITYHTLFWLDLYLTGSFEGFAPPTPFTLDELDPAGVLPERPYTKEELHNYLLHLRQRCQTTIAGLSDTQAHQPVAFPWTHGKPVSYLELLLYTMRHVQEHAAQLNMFLGQNGTPGTSNWVSRAKT